MRRRFEADAQGPHVRRDRGDGPEGPCLRHGPSVTAITGLGGPELLERHAIETAEAFNAMNPEYIGMLTLMVEPETPLYDWVQEGSFQLLTQPQVLKETRLLMEHLDSPGSVFRMNHASNYLVLKGTLNQDQGRHAADHRRGGGMTSAACGPKSGGDCKENQNRAKQLLRAVFFMPLV